MKQMTVQIVDCPINSFKLHAENITHYYEQSLREAREVYLALHDETYRSLMFDDFNPLWTPDRQAINNIDPKDGFWSMYVFFFNIRLIELLSDEYEIKIVDNTSYDFRNQKFFLNYLRSKGLSYSVNEKKRLNKSLKHSLKDFLKNTLINTRDAVTETIAFLNEEFFKNSKKPNVIFRETNRRKVIYLAIPPTNKKDILFYLSWRYKKIFDVLKKIKKRGYSILLVGIKDHEGLDGSIYPSINATRLVGKNECVKIFFQSLLHKIRVKTFIGYQLLKNRDPVRK